MSSEAVTEILDLLWGEVLLGALSRFNHDLRDQF
jgi:hypothetical protein